MIKNIFKTGLRNILKNKIFSAINIFGLSIGIATCILILLFVQNELSYDRFHEKANRIVRVVFRGSVQGEKMNEAHVMPPVAKTLLADFPEVEEATRLRNYGTPKVTYDSKIFRNNSFAFVDANFFKVFTLPLIKGDQETALTRPNTIIISEEAANKFFGNDDPLGKVLRFKDWNQDFTITGVMKTIPENSHFHFDLFASMETFPDADNHSWMVSEFHTYLVLTKGYNYKDLEAKLPEVAHKYISPQMQEAMGISLSAFQEAGNDIGLFLQPLTEIHLHSGALGDLAPGGDIRYVYIFSAIAFLMLLIASINFMNLSTAGASKRVREVGVRKVLGSGRRMLLWQFMMESILLTMFATLLALILVKLALPVFNQFAGKNLVFDFANHPFMLPVVLLITFVVGILAGSYPSLFLSSFNPVSVLKGAKIFVASGDKTVGIRSGLVVLQFIISIGLIICTMVVYQQLRYIQTKKLGYEKERVLILPAVEVLGKNSEAFRQQLLHDPRVISVSTSGYLPAGPTYNNNFFLFPDDDATRQVKTRRYDVDEHYIPTLGMQLHGRNLSSQYGTDSSSIIINETAAKGFGWKHDALGKTLTHADNNGKKTTYKVIAIVEDFHFKSLHEPISPLVMVLGRNAGSVIIKARPEDMEGLLQNIQKLWSTFNREEPFSYSFLDDHFNSTYQAERKLGAIMGVFAGLTIFVACLGLLGLVLFTAERRRKEIGIRKVNGAKVWEIMIMLNKDFIKWVAIAFIFATPIAWYAMHKWLQNFAYKMDLSWWVFAAAGLVALAIALITVSWQSWKAATRNPVEALRYE